MDYFKEILNTFSEQPSFFSSKKFERFIVFSVFLGLTIAYTIIHIKTLGATDFMTVVGIWLGYAGYNSAMTFRDKKLLIENPEENSQETK